MLDALGDANKDALTPLATARWNHFSGCFGVYGRTGLREIELKLLFAPFFLAPSLFYDSQLAFGHNVIILAIVDSTYLTACYTTAHLRDKTGHSQDFQWHGFVLISVLTRQEQLTEPEQTNILYHMVRTPIAQILHGARG